MIGRALRETCFNRRHSICENVQPESTICTSWCCVTQGSCSQQLLPSTGSNLKAFLLGNTAGDWSLDHSWSHSSCEAHTKLGLLSQDRQLWLGYHWCWLQNAPDETHTVREETQVLFIRNDNTHTHNTIDWMNQLSQFMFMCPITASQRLLLSCLYELLLREDFSVV